MVSLSAKAACPIDVILLPNVTQKQIKMTARAQKEYMDYCMLKQACIDYGKEEGKKEGRTEAKLEAARNMLSKNKLTLEEIAEYTELPLETVQQLAKELKIEA